MSNAKLSPISKNDLLSARDETTEIIDTVRSTLLKGELQKILGSLDRDIEHFDKKHRELSLFIELCRNHTVECHTYCQGYGDGAIITWYVDGQEYPDDKIPVFISSYKNFEFFVQEQYIETNDEDLEIVRYIAKMKADE